MIEKAKKALKQLNGNGFKAFLVGGCVRDILINRTPKDWDITTDASTESIKAVFPNNYPVGEKFGTVGVHWENSKFEITTFRSESNYDGRRPGRIQFEKDPKKDVCRRDFTINGLLMDKDEQIIDFVGGRSDLTNRIIRCIGHPQERFEEDYLRILRCIRFSCQLPQFTIHPHTYSQMQVNVGGLEKISKERITEELKKILQSSFPHTGMSLLTDISAWKYIIPEIDALKDCEQPKQYHKYDVYNHTWNMVLSAKKPLTFEMSMAILLHDIGKPRTKGFHNGRITFYGHENVGAEMSKDICNRLKLSNAEEHQITWLVKNHMKPHQATKMNKSTLAKLCRSQQIEDLIELNRLDCLNSNGDMTNYECLVDFYKNESKLIGQKPLLNGNHLLALGLKPSPEIKRILDEAFTIQLEGKISTTGQAIDWVLRRK